MSPIYTDDAPFDMSTRRSAAQLLLLMKLGLDWGYLLKPSKSLFIADNLEEEEEEEAMWEFDRAGLHINYVGGSRYLGA